MKYYHVIYNSSEQSMDGGVGFGIRTATEGIPDSILNVVRGVNFFTDDWETYENKPNPIQLQENPCSIESVPMNYAVTSLKDDKNNTVYVIARRAYVGFDYGFYINGTPTRPGNYVIDFYVFDSVPEKSAYELLYENPAENANHFIPRTVCPTLDNDDMRNISLGAPKPLLVEDKPFNGKLEDVLDKDVVKFFFYYLKARKENKKLIVKAGRDKAIRLTADLYRMLDKNVAKDVRVYVNLRSPGTNDIFDIFFILEDYPNMVASNALCLVVNIDHDKMPDILEAKLYAERMIQYVTDSYSSNEKDVADILKWIMMPEFDEVKTLSRNTIDAFFMYCLNPDSLTYDDFKQADGTLNEELMMVLNSYFKRNQDADIHFRQLVVERMSEAGVEDVLSIVNDWCAMGKCGCNMDDITIAVREHLCGVMLNDVAILATVLNTIGSAVLKPLLVKNLFLQHKELANAKELSQYLPSIYMLFFSDEDLQVHRAACILRFMQNDLKQEYLYPIIDDIYGNDRHAIIKGFNAILKGNHMPFKYMWSLYQHFLGNGKPVMSFTKEFSTHLDDSEYAPMFYYEYKTDGTALDSIEKIESFTNILRSNAGLKKLVSDNYKKDNIYSHVYGLVDDVCDKQPKETERFIRDNIIDFLNVSDDELSLMLVYIMGSVKSAETLSPNRYKQLYGIIIKHGNSQMFNLMLNCTLKHAYDEVLDYKEVAKNYKLFNPEATCQDAVAALSKSRHWGRMAGILMKNVYGLQLQEAMALLNQQSFDEEKQENILRGFYEKEYSAYQRKNKIGGFFNSLKNVFVHKPKKNAADKKTSSEK